MRGYPREDKNIAVEMRKNGKSYKEIERILGIPKSTLAYWLTKEDWSQKIKKVLVEKNREWSRIHMRELVHIRGDFLEKAYEEAREEAVREFEDFKYFPLFVTGISIYWGEGDKATNGVVRVANTDPAMIKIFVDFLRIVCGVDMEKIRGSIIIYPDLNPEECIQFWSECSGLPRQNFNKCITIQGRHKTRRLPYGVCNITTSSTYLKQKMFVWLSLLPEELRKQSAGIV